MSIKVVTVPKWFTPKHNDNDKDSEPLSVELAPMELGDYWDLSTHFASMQGKTTDKIDMKDLPKMATFKPYLEKYVKSIKGLYVNEKPGVVADLFGHAALFPVVMEIITELMSVATVSEAVKKK